MNGPNGLNNGAGGPKWTKWSDLDHTRLKQTKMNQNRLN